MKESQHTTGPWYADRNGYIWRRPPEDLYENGGGVAGDKPVAIAIRGWYNDGEIGYPVVANSVLMAAAPELLEALEEAEKELCKQEDRLRSLDRDDGSCEIAILTARQAIAKAKKAQP